VKEDWLPAEHGTDNVDLRGRVARGATWTILDNWGRQLVGLIVFVVIARLLTPVDFGLVALAIVFIAFAQLFVDQGLGDAIVQRRQLSRSQIDTAFWVSIGMGVALTLAGVVLAIPIAAVFGEPDLQPILQVLSLAFLITALQSVQLALLKRELAFRSLALRSLLAVSGGGVVGVFMALEGYGAWALVGQQLAQGSLSVLTLWGVSPWRPGLRFSVRDFREMFGFGVNVVGSDLLTWVSRNTDNLLIGAMLGPTPLGIYAVAYRILDAISVLLVGIARKVAFPGLSRLQQDPDRTKRAYLRMNRVAGLLILAGFLALAVTAADLIELVFGARWQAAGPVAAVLFLIGPVLALQAFSGALLYATGHPEVVFRFRLITTVTNVLGFAVAVSFGILAVAAAFVLRGYLLLPLNLAWVRRYAGVPAGEYLTAMRGPLLSALAMALAMLAVKLALAEQLSAVLLLAAQATVGVIVLPAALWLFDRPLMGEVIGVVRQGLSARGN
jgi:O-antigen/teichoic acid export membrane protein